MAGQIPLYSIYLQKYMSKLIACYTPLQIQNLFSETCMPLALFVTQSRFRVDCEYSHNGSTTAQSLNNSGIVSKANLCYSIRKCGGTGE